MASAKWRETHHIERAGTLEDIKWIQGRKRPDDPDKAQTPANKVLHLLAPLVGEIKLSEAAEVWLKIEDIEVAKQFLQAVGIFSEKSVVPFFLIPGVKERVAEIFNLEKKAP